MKPYLTALSLVLGIITILLGIHVGFQYAFYDPLLHMTCLPTMVKKDVSDLPLPQRGQYWLLDAYATAETDPWGRRDYRGPVYIVDVKEGWVRYKLSSWSTGDEHERLDRFMLVYQPCQPE